MGKRVTIISLIILISGLVVLAYFLNQGRKSLLTDPYKAIVPDACFVIETSDFQNFINSLAAEKGLFGEIAKVKEFDIYNLKIKYLADKLNQEGYKRISGGGITVLSLHLAEQRNLATLLSMTIPAEIRLRHVKDVLRESGITGIAEKNLNGKKLLELQYAIGGKNDTAFIAVSSGLLICSTSWRLFRNSLSQIELGNDIRNMPGFNRILLTSGRDADKIFLVFRNLPELVKTILGVKGKGIETKIGKLAGSAGGDIYLNEDGVTLSGYTESIDPTDYLYKYKAVEPASFQTYKVLPSATVLFESLVTTKEIPGRKADPSESGWANELADKLLPYIGYEITRAYVEIKNRPADENSLIIYKLSNRVQCELIFLASLNSEADRSFFQPDDQTRIPVYFTSDTGLHSILAPGFAPGFVDSYYTFYDNYMVTGNSYVTVSRFLYDNLLNKTLANDLNYRDFESTLPSRAGYFFFCIPSRITDYLTGFLNDDIIKGLRANRNSLDKIQAAGYQFASSNGMLYNSLSVRFKDEVREESTTEWETLLDTIASIKPFFFTNHNTGAKEIFVQDMKNNAYLINKAGRVLWKVPLKERTAGAVYMIDYFRNGKYQLLFSGKNNLHLLDRNGNYVDRYPIKLRSPATNSLALFDYDNNRDYRILIAGEDKMVYAYDKAGSVVKGWNPFRTAGYVKSEIGFFRVSGKDYLLVADESSIYFLDRKGNIRLNPREAVIKAAGSGMRLSKGSEPSIICTSPDGTVQQVFFDGSVRKFSIRQFTIDHSFDIFDVDSDGFDEYIFIDKDTLYLYDHDRKELFKRDFGSENLGGPINFVFSSTDKKIGVVDMNKKLIYLIDKNGKTMNGFPLRGASMFSIGKLSEKSGWHLIVGGTDRFLYNYKLETDIK